MKKYRKSFSNVRNGHGIIIKKCCASCRWKGELDSLQFRKCTLTGKKVRPRACCPEWQLHPGLKGAGSGGGEVRDICSKKVVLK